MTCVDLDVAVELDCRQLDHGTLSKAARGDKRIDQEERISADENS